MDLMGSSRWLAKLGSLVDGGTWFVTGSVLVEDIDSACRYGKNCFRKEEELSATLDVRGLSFVA